MKYEKIEKFSLRDHPVLNERWVQDRIAEDPTILGLGNVFVRDKERIQSKAGRLDLLLQDADTNRRYEVEIQLGKTDESHIIRTIEYWENERKHHKQFDHVAVIVAEEITSRFLNVISLFNGTIPLIAIQMNAVQLGGVVSLVFTTVLSEVRRDLVDDDEGVMSLQTAITGRHVEQKPLLQWRMSYWRLFTNLTQNLSSSTTKFTSALQKMGSRIIL